jgi:hypothetical protein
MDTARLHKSLFLDQAGTLIGRVLILICNLRMRSAERPATHQG